MTKYSLKNICLGIGIGLILASMANISASPRSLTIDEIKREAAKYNLMIINAKDLINKQPEEDKKEQQSTLQTEVQQAVIITIKSGTSSEGIAELLVTNKLIESKDVFLKKLTELKKENKLQIGTFKIPSGSSIDGIIEIITSSPK
ncbi:MAG: hypothetical protein A2Y23_03695 [Clostridiales bacterium GWB2_37_7]|nr:MAG: hypothetical protein A2Y23_03695 [Clostridiales bacterium GWB2_37_7]